VTHRARDLKYTRDQCAFSFSWHSFLPYSHRGTKQQHKHRRQVQHRDFHPMCANLLSIHLVDGVMIVYMPPSVVFSTSDTLLHERHTNIHQKIHTVLCALCAFVAITLRMEYITYCTHSREYRYVLVPGTDTIIPTVNLSV
jgi:hypothetical protein